jgi:hypothetical protein
MRRAANVGVINTRFSPFYQTKKPIAAIGLLMLPGINSSDLFILLKIKDLILIFPKRPGLPPASKVND